MRLTAHANYAAAATASRLRARYAEKTAKDAAWQAVLSAVAITVFAVMAFVNFGWLYLLGCAVFAVMLWAEIVTYRSQREKAVKENELYEVYARCADAQYENDTRSAR